MTTIDLYKQLKEGKIEQSKFLYEVRRDQNLPWILNTTSFEDAEKILKNKGIIKEWIQEDPKVTAMIDYLNPYQFKKAMEFEVSKCKDLNQATYIQLRAKVAKRIINDKSAYREFQEFNAKEIAKEDAKRQMIPVKPGNHVAEYNQMTKLKNQVNHKADNAPKTENRKGKPKDVKIMKESDFNIFKNLLSKKKVKLTEDTHYKYGHGQQVPLPKQDRETFGCDTGTIKDIQGGTLYLELEVTDENGQPLEIARQTNVIDHNMNDEELQQDKIVEPVTNSHGHNFKTGDTVIHENEEATIKSFKKDQGKMHALIPQKDGSFYKAVDVNDIKPAESDKEYRDKVFGKLLNIGAPAQNWLSKQDKLKEFFNKLKEESKKNKKKEVDEAMDVIKGKNQKGEDVTLDVVAAGKGVKTAQTYKQKGVKSATSTTVA
jgi:hypothetical protein